MKRVWEKIVEGILTCSGFVTSITILLIVVFLFAEALGLFVKNYGSRSKKGEIPRFELSHNALNRKPQK